MLNAVSVSDGNSTLLVQLNCFQACLASAFYVEPTDSRRAVLTSYYLSLESIPAAGPVAPAGIDAATYGILLSRMEQLRPASFLRPLPTSRPDFEAAIAARSAVEKYMEDGVDSSKKEMEISSALHSALDDIQQILSAGPSSSHDHTHLDEQALGEITAFLQSGPPVVWPENDAGRLTNVADNVGIMQQNFAAVSDAGPPVSVVSGGMDQKLMKPGERSAFEWHSESASSSVDDSTSAVVQLKRYQCVLCLMAFDLPPSAQHHNRSCSVCPGDVLEVPVYRCRRCGASYYSESAAHHHALFLCTRDDTGSDIGHSLRHYSCPVCQLAFFSSAGLQSHTACLHGTPQLAASEISTSSVSKVDGLTDNLSQSEIYPQQSGIVQAPAQIHSPFYMSPAAGSSPGSTEETSLPYKVSLPSEPTAVDIPTSQTKSRTRRRYSGRPPKGIIYKNVFMTSEGLYYCSTCSADLNTVERRTEHRGRPCGRASAASYARHYVFICPHCSSRWSSQKACYEHQITTCLPQIGVNVADLSMRRYACPICSRLHFSLAPLRGHMTTAHRLPRDEVIQRLIAAGYMTPEGSNVKFDNVVGMQEASMAKPSRKTSIKPSSAITEAEIIALLNKEINAALNEREYGSHNQSCADGRFATDTAEGDKKLNSSASKLSVLTAFPQLPKPVLNLRAIPKILATTLSNAVASSSVTSSPHTNITLTASDGTKSGVDNRFCNGAVKLESAVSKSARSSSSDLSCVSSSTTSVCSTSEELSNTMKDTSASDASVQELKCETSKNGDIVSPTSDVTSTAVSLKCHTTSSFTTEVEKQSNGCSNEVPVKNGKLKFIFNKSDVGSNSGQQQIQLPVVALERTTFTEVTPTISLSASVESSKSRQRQHASVHFSSPNTVNTRLRFCHQRIMNLRKSARVPDSWKPTVPVLQIPVNRPRKPASHHFSCKRSLSRGARLVDRQLRKNKFLKSKDITYDCFRGQRASTQSRQSRRQFAAVSSGANTDAISTRSQCRRIPKHSVVR